MNKMMNVNEEVARCLLCENAPCSKACGKGDVVRVMWQGRCALCVLAMRVSHGNGLTAVMMPTWRRPSRLVYIMTVLYASVKS